MNKKVGRPPRPFKHGELNGYRRGCRCTECATAKREYSKAHPTVNSEHGLPGTYNRGCRCPPCKVAFRRWRRQTHQTERINKSNREFRARARKSRTEMVTEIKAAPCADCKSCFPPECMDFDHILERGPKLFNIATALSKLVSIEKLLEEIAKCDLVCANCHRTRTKKRRIKQSTPLLPNA